MKLKLKYPQPAYCCPYCTKPVGLLGRGLAKVFGAGMHQCDFSNVDRNDSSYPDLVVADAKYPQTIRDVLEFANGEVMKERARCLKHLHNVSWSYPEAIVEAVNKIEDGTPTEGL